MDRGSRKLRDSIVQIGGIGEFFSIFMYANHNAEFANQEDFLVSLDIA
jgi:hypothetical protein